MASNAKSNTPSPKKVAEGAVEARDEAIRAHETAQAEHEAAKVAQADVERRLATGGDVTQAEHDAAVFEVRRAAGKVWSTEQVKIAAEHEAQTATAIAVAGELVDGRASRAAMDEAVAEAKDAVTKAVLSLVGKARHRNRAIEQAIQAGKAAGLQVGKVDPASPVVIAKKSHPHQPWRKADGHELLVDGEVEETIDLTQLVTATVVAAARTAGIEITVGGAR